MSVAASEELKLINNDIDESKKQFKDDAEREKFAEDYKKYTELEQTKKDYEYIYNTRLFKDNLELEKMENINDYVVGLINNIYLNKKIDLEFFKQYAGVLDMDYKQIGNDVIYESKQLGEFWKKEKNTVVFKLLFFAIPRSNIKENTEIKYKGLYRFIFFSHKNNYKLSKGVIPHIIFISID